MMVNLDQIKQAEAKLAGVTKKTPLYFTDYFSSETSNEVYLKLENLQITGSFKIRGAYNKISSLTDEEKRKGIVTHSAGNHGIGTAYAAKLLGIEATVILPENPNLTKKKEILRYGANVVEHGKNSFEMSEKVLEYNAKGMSIVHPFDDPYTIAGQGSIGLEIIKDLPEVDTVVIPISGGGLIAGIASALKQIKPNIQIIGVNAGGAQAMYQSLKMGRPTMVEDIDTIADGLMANKPGDITFAHVQKYVDDLVIVPEKDIAHTVALMADKTKMVVEPSGAAALAAVLTQLDNLKNRKIAVLVSGGNVDLGFYSSLIKKYNE